MSQEQVQGVIGVITATFTANNEMRNAAEQHLKQFELQKGYLPVLLQVILNSSVQDEVRQAASIHVKNVIRNQWTLEAQTDEGKVPLDPADKQVMRENLLEAIIFSHSSMKVQRSLVESLKLIVRVDFPENFPTLLQTIQAGIASQDVSRIFGSLLGLHAIFSKYHYFGEDKRDVQYSIAQATFPVLIQILRHCLTSDDSQAAHMCRIVSKCFWCCTSVHIAPFVLEPQTFAEWMAELSCLLAKRPSGIESGEILDHNPWWRARKWASRITCRMFEKFGNKKLIKDKENPEKEKHLKQFSDWFNENFSASLLHVVLNVLREGKNKGPMTNRIRTNCLNHLALAVGQANAFKVMRGCLDELLFEIIFPLLCHSDEDEEMWNDDPEEFIRRQSDMEENMYDARIAAISLLEQMCSLRKKHCLAKYLMFVHQILQQYRAGGEGANPRLMDGALRSVGALSTVIEKEKPYCDQIEVLVATFVVPELASPHPHLRALACWVLTTFSELEFSHCGGVANVLNGILRCVSDESLIVRYDGAKSLRHLIDFNGAKDAIRPQLEFILNSVFHIMAELGSSEELMDTIEKLLEEFGDEMGSQCVVICAKLCAEFDRLMANSDDDDEAALTCLGIIRTWRILLSAAEDREDACAQIEQLILPRLLPTLSNDTIDFMDSAMELISLLAVQRNTVSPLLWTAFPHIYNVFNSNTGDFGESILITLDNYISQDPITFANSTNPDYAEMVMQMCAKTFTLASPEDCFDAQQMVKLMESAFQNTKPYSDRMDRFRRPSLELILATCQRVMNNQPFGTQHPTVINFCLLCVNTVSSIVYSSCQSFVRLVDEQMFVTLLQFWFAILPKLPRPYDKKSSAIAFMSFLALKEMPAHVQRFIPQIFTHLITLLQQIASQIKEENEENESDGGEESLGDDDDEEDEDSQQELDDEEDYDEKHNPWIERISEAVFGQEEEYNLDEEVDVFTPLDDLDEFVLFSQLTHTLSQTNGQGFQQLLQLVGPQGQLQIEELNKLGIAHFHKQQAEKEKEKAENPTENQQPSAPYISF
eukprot:c19007_g1_i1.p1 GENE.c19007_g1_i1~~c19007_g1_i1.p1  ORF type:complete len:1055 (+),score=485.71 c19007_g1_i1:24-3167(+)